MVQQGISPKVIAQATAAVLAWVVAYLGLDISPELSATVATVAGAVSGYFTPPGEVR